MKRLIIQSMVTLLCLCSTKKPPVSEPNHSWNVGGVLAAVEYDKSQRRHYISVRRCATGARTLYPILADAISGLDISFDKNDIIFAVRKERRGPKMLKRLHLADSTLHDVLQDSAFSLLSPGYSPDKTRLVFYKADGDREQKIGIFTFATQSVRYFDNVEGKCHHPDWSPTGDTILFARRIGRSYNQKSQICILDIKTETVTVLVESASRKLIYPVWRMDGVNILFTEMTRSSIGNAGGDLFVLNRRTGQSAELPVRGSPVSAVWMGGDSLIAMGLRSHVDKTFSLVVHNYVRSTSENLTLPEWIGYAPAWRR